MNKLLMGMFALLIASVSFAGAIEDEIAARLAPVGEVCVAGEECAVATAASAGSGEPRSGEEVYKASCGACHDTPALGAPVIGVAADWAPRIAKGIEALYASGINGVPGTSMMANGTCGNCSEDEIKATVDYMVENSQ